jgi:2-keto-3-deoxy-L-rhamnonate aldolase RhmA
MGLLDKAKDRVAQATEMAKDAAQKGQAKLDDVQSKRGADGILRDLGAAVYATKSGRSTPSTEADIARLVSALQAHESQHGALTLAPESAAAGPTAAPAPPPAAADPSSPPPPPPAAQTL